MFSSGPVAQRIRHLTTNQGIAGSSPARVKFSFRPKWIVTFRLDLSSLNRGQILFKSTSYLRQCLPREKYMASWRENKIIHAPPGGLEPPTFRLTAERASRLRHGGCAGCPVNATVFHPHVVFAMAGFPLLMGWGRVRLSTNIYSTLSVSPLWSSG